MEVALDGLRAAPGYAAGAARVLAPANVVDRGPIPPDARESEEAAAVDALDLAAAEVDAIAAGLRGSGRDAEAEIIETGALIARDPTLQAEIAAAVGGSGVPAAAALLDVTAAHAELIGGLGDPRLAERADDVRSIGRRAAGIVGHDRSSTDCATANGSREILIATDLGPAEVAELEAGVAGIALAAGGVSAHAAIVARSLGIPMVVGVGNGALAVASGSTVVVDGSNGILFLDPDPATVKIAELDAIRRDRLRARATMARDLPAVTRDGHPVRVLANVSGAAEVRAALDAGAEGVGLLRTELSFLTATDWPSETDHRRVLAPVLELLQGRLATVRVLDFGADKTPPFLAGIDERGVTLLLDHPVAFAAQLRAILSVAGSATLRILLPMVDTVDQVRGSRDAIASAAAALPTAAPPRIGAMIETAEGVAAAKAIAAEVDFLSIGTNDLTHSILRADRFSPQSARAHDPRVLRAIATVVDAARRAGVPVEVCGEAASDPTCAPLLIGGGVDELSVGTARVGTVREWVRSVSFEDAVRLEVKSRRMATQAQVEELTSGLPLGPSLLERADADGEVLERPIGVGAAGAEAQGRSTSGA